MYRPENKFVHLIDATITPPYDRRSLMALGYMEGSTHVALQASDQAQPAVRFFMPGLSRDGPRRNPAEHAGR